MDKQQQQIQNDISASPNNNHDIEVPQTPKKKSRSNNDISSHNSKTEHTMMHPDMMASGSDLCSSPSTATFIDTEVDSDEHFKTSLFSPFSFPKNVPYQKVAKEIIKMGYESTVSQLLWVASITVLMMTVGKVLDLENYAAVGIGFSVFNIFCVAPTFGFSSALDTLATAAYGRSPTGPEVGQLTQLAMGFGFVLSIFMSFFFLFGSDIFVALVFGENYVHGAGLFLRYIIPAALTYSPMVVIQKSLQAQLLSRPPMLATFVGVAATTFGCFTLVPWLGIPGVSLTMASMYITQLVALLYFAPADALFKKVSWTGTFLTSKQQFLQVFSRENVVAYVSTGFVSMTAICAPWYIWEMILVVAARMGETEVAYFNIFMNIVNLCWCWSAGFATSASSFVGKALGGGKGNLALAYARSTWILSQMNIWIIIIIYLIFNRQLAFMYTKETTVVEMLSKNLALVCLSIATDDIQFVGFAIFRGCGKQKEAPPIVMASWGVFGIPIGCLLAFHFEMGATGLMLGLAIGDVIKIAIQIYRVQYSWGWEKMAESSASYKAISVKKTKETAGNNSNNNKRGDDDNEVEMEIPSSRVVNVNKQHQEGGVTLVHNKISLGDLLDAHEKNIKNQQQQIQQHHQSDLHMNADNENIVPEDDRFYSSRQNSSFTMSKEDDHPYIPTSVSNSHQSTAPIPAAATNNATILQQQQHDSLFVGNSDASGTVNDNSNIEFAIPMRSRNTSSHVMMVPSNPNDNHNNNSKDK